MEKRKQTHTNQNLAHGSKPIRRTLAIFI